MNQYELAVVLSSAITDEERADKPNGYGKFKSSNGDFYIGEWTDGKANGKGRTNNFTF